MKEPQPKYMPDGAAWPNEVFPAKLACIYWNYNEGVCDVTVSDGFLPDNDAPQSSGGAVCSDWCDPDHPTAKAGLTGPGDRSPEGVFGKLLATGFKDRVEVRRALYAFAKIKECEWAQRMLFACDAAPGGPRL